MKRKLQKAMVNRLVTLKCREGHYFIMKRKVAEQSQFLKSIMEYVNSGASIPLYQVTSEALDYLLMYCEKHLEEPLSSDEQGEDLTLWDSMYIKEVKKSMKLLGNLVIAADYLEIEGLLDLTSQAVPVMTGGKKLEEIRRSFK